MPTSDHRAALTTMMEMHLIEQFGQWISAHRKERTNSADRPLWRVNLYTREKPGQVEFIVKLSEPDATVR